MGACVGGGPQAAFVADAAAEGQVRDVAVAGEHIGGVGESWHEIGSDE